MPALKAKSAACVVASCEPVSGSRPSLTQKKSLVHIKAATHLVLSRGRGQVDTRGLHFSSGGMSEGSEGLVATQKCSPHFGEINQSLEEQDCHFLDECWKISLAINLSRSSSLLSGLYKVRKLQPSNNLTVLVEDNRQPEFNILMGVKWEVLKNKCDVMSFLNLQALMIFRVFV